MGATKTDKTELSTSIRRTKISNACILGLALGCGYMAVVCLVFLP